MTRLLVSGPASRTSARRYALDFLLTSKLGITYDYRNSGTSQATVIEAPGSGPARVSVTIPDLLLGVDDNAWLTRETMPAIGSVDMPEEGAHPFGRRIPTLFPHDDSPDFAYLDGASWVLPFDVIGATFFLLARYEEFVLTDLDEHGRFPLRAATAYRAGSHLRPLLDEYAVALGLTLDRAWPGIQTKAMRGRLLLSHDVDLPLAAALQPSSAAIRHVAGDLVKRRAPRTALGNLAAWATGDRGTHHDSFHQGLIWLAETASRRGLPAQFLLKGGMTNERYDVDIYLGQSWFREFVRHAQALGHRFGIHPSYESYASAATIRNESNAVRSALLDLGIVVNVTASRQHYLRWGPASWSVLEEAGIDVDSTLGWAEDAGFRAGTAERFRGYDLRVARPVAVFEQPLIAMDGALMRDRDLDEVGAVIATLARGTAILGGTLLLLVHNSWIQLPRLRAWYAEVLDEVRRHVDEPPEWFTL